MVSGASVHLSIYTSEVRAALHTNQEPMIIKFKGP